MAFKDKFSLQNLRIWQRLALGFGAVVLVIIAMVVVLEVLETNVEREVQDIVSDNQAKTLLLNTMSEQVHIVGQHVSTLLLLRGTDPARGTEEVKKITDARTVYDKAWAALQKLPGGQEGLQLRRVILAAQVAARPVTDQVIALAARGDYDGGFQALSRGLAQSNAWQEAIDRNVALQTRQSEDGYKVIVADFVQLKLASALLGLLAILMAIGFGWLNTRSITGPVRDLQDSIGKVRAGDVQALAAVTRRDEMGDVARAVNELLLDRMEAQKKAEDENKKLNDAVIGLLQAVFQLSQNDLTAKATVDETVIGTVASAINQLADSTGQVLGEVNHVAGRVTRSAEKVRAQSTNMKQTSGEDRASVGEMLTEVAQVADQMVLMAQLADSTNQAAEQASVSTGSALERVSGTMQGMQTIRDTIAETEKRIKRLGERSQEITGIVNLINTIAERTHVLALNASMQAAIAGDAGRGFAVVAEEVQRLAESSRNATQQIATLVQNIQIETNETINTVNNTITQVVAGSEAAQRAGEQMRETQKITGNLADLVRRIADGTQMQTRAAAGMRTRLDAIGRGAERSAGEIEAQTAEANTLADAAQALLKAVAVFKLPASAKIDDTRSMKLAA